MCICTYICIHIINMCVYKHNGFLFQQRRNCAFWGRVIAEKERKRERSDMCIDPVFLSSSFSFGKSALLVSCLSSLPSSFYLALFYCQKSFVSIVHNLIDSQWHHNHFSIPLHLAVIVILKIRMSIGYAPLEKA